MSIRPFPAPADAACVAVYRDLREGVPKDSAQIGYGYNLYPAAPATDRHVQQVLARCQRQGRLHEYGTAHDAADRALAAELAGEYLGVPVGEEQVMFTAGASEGIGLVARYLAACDTAMILPAPCYFAFEQATRRNPAAIAGRYREDGTVHWSGGGARHTALVETLPNGVTGDLFVPPAVQADFRLLDIVFQAGGHAPDPHLITDRARAALNGTLTDTAVMMTPSKDLCVPGLRAGLLISGDTSLINAARDDVFNRVASPSPLAGQLVLLYLTVLLMAEAAHHSSGRAAGRRYAWLRAAYRRHDVDCPTEQTLQVIARHLDAMSTHFEESFHLLTEHGRGLLEIRDHLQPVAGYSLLPGLTADLDGPEELIAWVNRVGREHRLKVNPTLLFGGTRDSWSTLYPGRAAIRVNLSVPHDDLLHTLALLRTARHGLATAKVVVA
ncbi:aminotransferase class I/II-fold pyridoxal phosphate-dependent enzyme [Kitasatospora sp. NPDC088779]|uniref:aminotransferase class I/II-fold pyridoxal phosphate-dependent enzyme n=1 Tax=Kitasatospora sp. NPDC088779 TaxID=3154964 RepID=UPI003422E3AA